MEENAMDDGVTEIVEKHKGKRGAMISILEEVQDRHGYLSTDALKAVAEQTGRSLVDVYGVATFYRAFRLKPRGKHLCLVCQGTACHVRGAPAIADEVRGRLGVAAGETTADKQFTLEHVNCLGACALGPIVVVDGHYFSNVSKSRVKEILEQAREGIGRAAAGDLELAFPLEVGCARCNHGLMDPDHQLEGYPSIRVIASADGRNGLLRLSSVYGIFRSEAEGGFAPGTVLRVFCPRCHAEMTGASVCPDCDAPFVPLAVQGGGVLQVCSRVGCGGHFLDLSGINA
jgi:NADH-quinone oxidoreductase subunit E